MAQPHNSDNTIELNYDGMNKLGDVHYQTDFSEYDLTNDDSGFCVKLF